MFLAQADMELKVDSSKFTWHFERGSSEGDSKQETSLRQKNEVSGVTPPKSEVAQSCLTLCDPMDCSLPGSSILGIFQAWILEWIAIAFSRGSSRPRDRTQVSLIAGGRFTVLATREAPVKLFPCGFEPGTFCMLGKRDNHYTTETTHVTRK